MRTRSFLLQTLVVLLVVAAGCIAPPDRVPAGERTVNAGGEMTAKESRADAVAVCREDLGILPAGQFCAERTIEIDGSIAGIERMDVDLSTFNGAVELFDHQEGEWALKAVLRARGATAEQATANLDKIAFTWAHVDAGSHFLSARAEAPGRDSNGLAASIFANLPRSIDLVVVAGTSNGNVQVRGVSTDGLAVQTSNGNVELDAAVSHVVVGTSNGQVEAKLRPVASGRIAIATSNGAIQLTVPEDAEHGYDLDAKTSNGKVTIHLRDGETTRPEGNPYYDPQNDARFLTNGFASRDIQSIVELGTSNGAITVSAG